MEKEKLEIVLEEVLEELKTIKDVVVEQKKQAWQLQEKVDGFENKLDAKKLMTPPANITSIQSAIETSIFKIRQIVSEIPKSVIYQKRFLFFPEHNAREYYRIIFRLIMWMTLVIMVISFFALGKQGLEDSKEVKLKQLEANQYKNAWEYLYRKENKQGKKEMDEVWRKSWHGNHSR